MKVLLNVITLFVCIPALTVAFQSAGGSHAIYRSSVPLFSTTEENAPAAPAAPAAVEEGKVNLTLTKPTLTKPTLTKPTLTKPTLTKPTLTKPTLTKPTLTKPAAPGKPTENKQPLYGKTLEMPDTYVRCGKCSTSFAMTVDDLGEGKGRRVECSVCSHTWFQSRDRFMDLNQGLELVPLPKGDLTRIQTNIQNNRPPNFTGVSKLYVGNLDFRTTEDDITELFAKIGEVGETSLITGPDGRSRGFAFVTMMTKEGGDEAIQKLNDSDFNGRNLSVKEPNN